jgi:hypothetical protein
MISRVVPVCPESQGNLFTAVGNRFRADIRRGIDVERYVEAKFLRFGRCRIARDARSLKPSANGTTRRPCR